MIEPDPQPYKSQVPTDNPKQCRHSGRSETRHPGPQLPRLPPTPNVDHISIWSSCPNLECFPAQINKRFSPKTNRSSQEILCMMISILRRPVWIMIELALVIVNVSWQSHSLSSNMILTSSIRKRRDTSPPKPTHPWILHPNIYHTRVLPDG